jgi:LuxR family maltose regulon positive regulatory protein
MVEIRANQLRLTKEELAEFFKSAMSLELLDDDLSALEARTEGWIAGVQLAALSMQGCMVVYC